jgi:hypothetical protein
LLELSDASPTRKSVEPLLEKRRPPSGRVTFAGSE